MAPVMVAAGNDSDAAAFKKCNPSVQPLRLPDGEQAAADRGTYCCRYELLDDDRSSTLSIRGYCSVPFDRH